VDSDGDGISDVIETNNGNAIDSDGDGDIDANDTDSDENGVLDSVEGVTDSDGDGTGDWADLDNDADGYDDVDEIAASGGTAMDTDGDGDTDWYDKDADGDGLLDGDEAAAATTDTDGDGNEDFLDLDSDNDGIPDLLEYGLGSFDTNGNGRLSSAEILASGLDTNLDNAIAVSELTGGVLPDTDADSTPNFQDLDSDADGLTDLEESGRDKIGNELQSFKVFDLNDNDRIDSAESASLDDGSGSDLSGGAHDNNSVVNVDELPDKDGDGIKDYLDIDSDNDGVPDVIENGRYICDANGNGKINYPGEVTGCTGSPDTNADGFLQEDEVANLDQDSDSLFSYRDRDSDGDGVGDILEAYPNATNPDTNLDGFVSAAEYAVAVALIGDNDATLDYSEIIDTDGDTTKDIHDLDSDGDTIADVQESDDTNDDYLAATVIHLRSELYSTDADTVPDYRDIDSDADTVLDSVEAGDASLLTPPVNTDGNGHSSYEE
jgi:hypothetical protein